MEMQDDEALLDEVLAADHDDDDVDDDDDSEGLNASDVAQATDEEDRTAAPNSVRQRRSKQ